MRRYTLARLCAMCATIFILLQGCAAVKIEDYARETPKLELSRYFTGKVDAWGMFQDRSGKVIKRFAVTIDGQWTGNAGTLDERFTYADGSTQRRVWKIRKDGPDRYIGTADDVVGEAIGEAVGNTLRWRYVMALPVDGKIYNVDFDDWMYLMDDRVMLNRSTMSKFGFRLGEVTISFVKS